MTFKTIIKDEIRGNLSTYKEYFLATILSVALIFMSLMVLFHPDMQVSTLAKNFLTAAKAITVIIAVFLFIFIYYSEYTFIRHRSRNYAMFSILGMKRSQLTFMNFCESFTVFFSAFICGIAVSMLFAKLIFMAFEKMLDLDQMGLYFPSKALIITAIIFVLVFIVIAIASMLVLRKTQVKEFLQFGKKEQKQRKANLPVAIIGVLLLVAGYSLAATANIGNLTKRIIPVCLMVIAGMYCFYRELCPFILNALSKNKKFYYKGTNMLWVSDLKYRIKDFTMILFLITVTMTVGLTGFSAVINVSAGELSSDAMNESDYQIAVDAAPDSPTIAQVEDLLDSLNLKYQKINARIYSTERYTYKSTILIKESDLPIFLDPQELSAIDFAGADTLRTGLKGRDLRVAFPYQHVIAVKDCKISEYNKGFENMDLSLYSYEGKANIGRGLMKIEDRTYQEGSQKGDLIYSSSLFRHFYFIIRRSYLFLSFYFVIIFFICAGCMLYFKFFNNAIEEGIKYSNYSKVGLSLSEIRRSSSIQMASLFFLPIILTIVSTAFAMLPITGGDNPWKTIAITTIIVLFTIVVQIIYFLILRHNYLKKIIAQV